MDTPPKSNQDRKREIEEALRLAEERQREREEKNKQAEEQLRQATEAAQKLSGEKQEPKKKWGLFSKKDKAKETENEEEIEKDIENLPEEDKEKLGWGLNVIGFRVEKMKNDFFAGTLNQATKKLDEKSTAGRFFTELKNSFVRDSEEARKKGLDIQEGKEKGKLSKIRNVGLLAGNVLKYGRIVADLTGASIANPFRYAMLGGMATTRIAEAGKETRFKNEELIEKTRIQDADKAAEEAWEIYNRAQWSQNGAIGGSTPTIEEIKKAYLTNMPKDLLNRLRNNPTVTLSFVQKVLRDNMLISVNNLNRKLSWVGYSKRLDEK